jgi:hypothetical protein
MLDQFRERLVFTSMLDLPLKLGTVGSMRGEIEEVVAAPHPAVDSTDFISVARAPLLNTRIITSTLERRGTHNSRGLPAQSHDSIAYKVSQ